MKRAKNRLLIVLISLVWGVILMIQGCDRKSDLPFQYRYVSSTEVQVVYQGRTYQLHRYGAKIDTPFEYEFEDDGDLDISIAGKTYDLDSPYDIDVKKKKKKKKKAIKKSKKTKKSKKKTNKTKKK